MIAYELLAASLPYSEQTPTEQIVWSVVNEAPNPPLLAQGSASEPASGNRILNNEDLTAFVIIGPGVSQRN